VGDITDFDWVRSAIDILSTLGCCFILRSVTILGKQFSIALSTIEMDYITTNIARRKAMLLQNIIARIHPRHDAEGSNKSPVSRDEIGVMHKEFLTERDS
jgi:hypothetical protein